MRISWLLVLFMCVVAETAYTQSFYAVRRERNVIGTIGTGTASYYGDLKNPGLSIDAKPNINVGLQYFLNPRISVRSEVTWFHLSASDTKANDDRRLRNLSFYSDNYEINISGLVSLFPNRGGRFYRRVPINFYGFLGVGMAFINPKTKTKEGQSVALQPLMTEGVKYSRFQFVIPYGIGIRLKQGPYMNICIEGGLRKTFTDYIDDVSSTRYPDPAKLSSNLSRELSDRRAEYNPDFVAVPNLGKRGNPKNNDGYFLLNIKIEYYLPYDIGTSGSRKFQIFNPRKRYDFNKRKYIRSR